MKSIFGVEIPDSLRELTDPKGCGLIVYDMQVGIIGQIKDGAAITDRVKQGWNLRVHPACVSFIPATFFCPTVNGRLSISPGDVMAAAGGTPK